jgi:hypothetical protein
MIHSAIEELLGAYALDAVEETDVVSIEAHLDECPRCRAELAQHREVASLFSASPDPAPSQLWQQISAALSEPDPEYAGRPAIVPLVPIGVPRDERRRIRLASGVLGVVAAAAGVLAVVFSLQLTSLRGQINRVRSAEQQSGLAQAITAAFVSPHREAVLSSGHRHITAEVLITPSGEGYWVKSSLPALKNGETYQLWATVDGKLVSVGLVGSDPNRYVAFRVGRGSSALMVTAEPAGGSPRPTTPVLLSHRLQR